MYVAPTLSSFNWLKCQMSHQQLQLSPHAKSKDKHYADGPQFLSFQSEKEAVEAASQNPDTVDAVIAFDTGQDGTIKGYTLRVNHTEVPSTRARLNLLDVKPSGRYKDYWLFANMQLHLDRYNF